jgi:cytochrome P450
MSMIRLMGHDYSKIPNGENIAFELIDTFRGTFKLVHTLARVPMLKRLTLDGPLKRFLAPHPNDGTTIGRFLGFRDQLIQAELQNKSKQTGNHLMDHLLRKAANTDGTKMTWAEIQDDLNGFLLNPPETTGHTILSIILRVSANSSILEKVVAEIKSVLVASGSDYQPVRYDEICGLRYLKACVREALRLDPPGVSYLPRWVKSGGWTLPGNQGFIPSETEIASSPWVIGRNKNIYGEDADEYRPERWLENVERAEEYAKFDFAWGFGTRRCLGKGLAMFGIYKIIFQVKPLAVVLWFLTC